MSNVINLNAYFAQTIPEMVQKMGSCHFSIGSSHLVQVTHINNPYSFYVRISTFRYSVKLLESRGPPITLADLSLGKIVVYKSRIANHAVRGRIQKVDLCEKGQGMVCSILAIDYGFIDTHVSLKNIYLPQKSSMLCGPLAIHCQLNTCEPMDDIFDQQAIHAMKFFVGKYTCKIIIKFKSIEKLKVELRSVECREDVATMLALLNFTSFFRLHNRPAIMSPEYKYKHRTLKAGDKLHVRVQNGSSIYAFYVAQMDEYQAYDNVVEWYKFTKYCMKQPKADVVAALDGRSCGVKVLNPVRYERAIVKRITVPRAKALVQLIDWGKEIEANFEDIRIVPDEFNEEPAMALYCTSDRFHCMNHGLELRMIYPGLQFLLEIMEPGNSFRIPHRVKLYPLFPVPRPVLTDDEDE